MSSRPVRRSWGLALVAAACAACAPLYLPPVPRDLPPIETQLHLTDVEATVREGLVRVAWTPRGVEASGWLAAQWFPPSGGPVASESVWLGPEEEGVRQAVTLPPEVEPRPGRWRTVLTFRGRVLRQVAWTWPPAE